MSWREREGKKGWENKRLFSVNQFTGLLGYACMFPVWSFPVPSDERLYTAREEEPCPPCKEGAPGSRRLFGCAEGSVRHGSLLQPGLSFMVSCKWYYCSHILQSEILDTRWGRNARLKAGSQVLWPDFFLQKKKKKKRCVLMFVWQIHSRKYSFLSVTIRAKLNDLFNATAFLIGLIDPFWPLH